MFTFIREKYVRSALTLALGVFLALGLSACADSETETATDTATATADTAMNEMQQAAPDTGSVTLQSTSQLLTSGITQISAQQAVQNIDGWQQQLGGVSAQGAAQEAVSGISSTLGDLKSALQGGGQPEAQQVGQAFEQLGTQMSTLLENAQGLNLQSQQEQQLRSMQQAFQQTSQELMNMGG